MGKHVGKVARGAFAAQIPPQKAIDEEKDVSVVEEEAPETAVWGTPSSAVPKGHVWESFLQIAYGADRSAAYVKPNDGSSVHMAPYINKGVQQQFGA